jgi:CHAT domain-containing protein/tetratricopeptide (TPR) repeat protein
LAILEKSQPDGPTVADCLNRLGSTLYSDGKYGEALEVQKRALAIYEKQTPPSQDEIAITLSNVASDCHALRNFDEAIKFRSRELEVLESIRPESLEVARCLDDLGGSHYAALQYEKALQAQQRALTLYEKLSPEDDKTLAILIKNTGLDLTGLHRYDEAIEHLNRALKIHERGPETLDMTNCLNGIGWAHNESGRYREAIKAYQRALVIRESLLGAEDPEVAENLASLANSYIELGDYQQAKDLRERALAIREKALGPEHLDTIQSLNDLGASFDRLGDLTRARELYERSLTLREKHLGPEDRLVGFSLNNLCLLYFRMGLPAESEKAGLRALAIFEMTVGKDSPDTAFCLNSLGLLYNARTDYSRARQFLAHALAIREKSLGPGHPQTGVSLNNLALVSMNLRDYAHAIPLFVRALEIGRKFNGDEHPETALRMANLGWAASRLGQLETARQWYSESLAVRRKVLGADHYDTAANLDDLSSVLRRQGKLEEALPLCLEALETRLNVLSPEHPAIADSYEELALLYDRLNDPQAEEQYRKALAIRERAYGPSTPSVATTLTNLGSLYQSRKEYGSAEPLYQRALAICQQHLEMVSELQAERQQLAMARAYRWHLDWYVDLVAESEQEADDLYGHVLNWKGAVLARQRSARLGQEAYDPNIASTFADLQDTSGRLAALVLNEPAEEDRSAWREKIAQLTNQRQKLEEELSRISAQFRQQRAAEDVTAVQIQASLPEDAVLIDLLEYSHRTDAEKNEWEDRLVAFVVKPQGNIQLVPLGAATPLYDAVDAWRKTYGRSQSPSQALRQLLWDPLAEHVGDAQLVLISPDGGLGRFSWAALPIDASGNYLIEKLGVAVIPVPQMIPSLAAAPGPAEYSLCLVGDVDFGAEVGASSNQVVSRAAAGGRADVLRNWPPLPATRAEILAVRDSFESWRPESRVRMLRNAAATEQQLRQIAAQSRYLHMATHGFFAPEELKTLLSAPIDVAHGRSPSESKPADGDLPAISAGIGAALEIVDGKLVTNRILSDGAAGLDGRLKVGDQIDAVAEAEGEFQPLEDVLLSDAVKRIRGPVETRVRLKITPADGSAAYVLELTRRPLPRQEDGDFSIESLHPGLLSGIVLAGANHPPDPSKDDGVLTALEVADLDLRRVELATLSACETGLGATANGEGLLGLQRAFQVAGARSVVASLWKVDDTATRDLMERFYENLWRQTAPDAPPLSKLHALREAQLWMLKERGPRGLVDPEQKPADESQQRLPPYYWAAFVLSGDWR